MQTVSLGERDNLYEMSKPIFWEKKKKKKKIFQNVCWNFYPEYRMLKQMIKYPLDCAEPEIHRIPVIFPWQF